jgi:diguanylate cyclase (GGDEF)-like protein
MTFTEVNRSPNIILNERWFILTGITKEEDKLCTKDSIFKIILLEYLDQKMYFIACIILSYFIVLSYTLYRKNIKNISDMATYDKLTGAYSRSRGFEIVKMDMEFAKNNNRAYSVCFIDLNDLKKVNDKYGHEMGDLYLKDSVNMIKSRLNYRENIVRMGGDEFLVGVFKSKEEIDFGWQCLIEDAKSYNEKSEYPFEISLSHGVASIDEKEVKTLDDMIILADKRMYVEKRAMKEKIRRS